MRLSTCASRSDDSSSPATFFQWAFRIYDCMIYIFSCFSISWSFMLMSYLARIPSWYLTYSLIILWLSAKT